MGKSDGIHLIPTFHHDIAYLKPEADYTQKAIALMDRALELLERDTTYTFTVEQACFFWEYWQLRPQRQDDMRKFASQGRLVFAPGFWAVPDMNMPSGESIYQTATCGIRVLKYLLGSRPRTALIADCWGHHPQLPQILTDCGYEYYMFSRCMNPELSKERFRWQGIDGSVLNCQWLYAGYAGLTFPNTDVCENAEEMKWQDAGVEGLKNLMEQGAQYGGSAPWVVPVGGDMKMPAESALTLVPKLQQDPRIPKPEFSTLDVAMDAVDFGKTPVYQGDFNSAFQGTFTTNIRLKRYNREMEWALYGLEALSVLKNRQIDLEDAWRLTLKNQFHDILCGTICDAALEQAYQEYEQLRQELEKKRKMLSASGEKTLLNVLPFPVVELRGERKYEAEAFSYGRETQLTKITGEVPSIFENRWYHVKLNSLGFITQLQLVSSGKMIYDNGDIPFGSFVLETDNGDNWDLLEYPGPTITDTFSLNEPDPYDRTKMSHHPNIQLAKIGVEEAKAEILSDGSLRIIQRGMLKYWVTQLPFTTSITFSKDSPRIDYHTEYTAQNRRIRLRVVFPTQLAGGAVRHQIPFGLFERGEGTHPVEYFMDLQKDKVGLALINHGIPSNNTHDGIMMLTLFRSAAMEYKCQSEGSYNLGAHLCSDYSIVPHDGSDDILLWQQAVGFQRPLMETTREPLSAFKVEGAMVSALRHDDGAVFLRIYNGVEKPSTAKIVPPEMKFWQKTNGCMEPIGEKLPIDGEITIPLGSFQVQGIKMFAE